MSHGGGHSGGHSGSGGDSHHSGHYGHDSSGHNSGGDTLGSLFGLGGMDSIVGQALGLTGGHSAGHHSGGHTHSTGFEAQLPYVPINSTQPGSLMSRVLGIRIGSGFWLAVFFIVFMSWLGLISFLRHHDPNAKEIFGTLTNTSSTQVTNRTSANPSGASFPETQYLQKKSFDMQLYGRPDTTVSADTKPTETGASQVMWGMPVQSRNGPKIRYAVTR